MEILKFIEEENLDTLSKSKTSFELNSLILGGKAGITPWKKLKSCKKEINSRYHEIKMNLTLIAEQEVEKEQYVRKLSKVENEQDREDADLDQRSLEVDISFCDQEIESLKSKNKDLIAECEILKEIYTKVKAEVKELYEKYSDEDLEVDSFVRMVIEEVNNQLLANQIGSNINLIGTIRGVENTEIIEHVMSNIKQMLCENMVDNSNLQDVARKYIEIQKKRAAEAKENPESQEETQVVDLQQHMNPENES